MSDTPRTDVEAEENGLNRVVSADFARQLERELAEARRDASASENVLWGNGFVRCDIPACNCGSWHYRYGLPERMDEIREALRDADVLDNSTGNLPLNAIKKLVTQRDEARSDAERYRWLRELPNADRLNLRYMGIDLDGVIDAAIDAAMKS